MLQVADDSTTTLDRLDVVPSASFGRRLIALLIDWAVALLTVALIAGSSFAGEDRPNPFLDLGVFYLQVWVLTGLLGFTIGKRLLRMRVEGPDGRPIGLLRAALRTALLCLVVPAILQNEEGRGFHDIAANSRVVRT
ncbi:RDD family protein [Aeromicrobium sp. CTD01-1L150]|uniref:RDD family protein n=1 Tax=Aeromicrobium sp. CTD01-1L150 TaxID=3341830 RepID=UPI0035C07A37